MGARSRSARIAPLVCERAPVFKGGTCLKKCYFEAHRFSEHLDFTVREQAQPPRGTGRGGGSQRMPFSREPALTLGASVMTLCVSPEKKVDGACRSQNRLSGCGYDGALSNIEAPASRSTGNRGSGSEVFPDTRIGQIWLWNLNLGLTADKRLPS